MALVSVFSLVAGSLQEIPAKLKITESNKYRTLSCILHRLTTHKLVGGGLEYAQRYNMYNYSVNLLSADFEVLTGKNHGDVGMHLAGFTLGRKYFTVEATLDGLGYPSGILNHMPSSAERLDSY